jgi:hypothetical protein
MSDAATAIQAALNAEYATIYGYGLVGSHVSGAARTRAARALTSHIQQRDQLRDALHALGSQPTPPAASYDPTTPITDSQTAVALAIAMEEQLVRAWSLVASVSPQGTRSAAIHNASSCAVRAISWGAASQAFP